MAPLGRVGHDDGAAEGIVLCDAHLLDGLAGRQLEFLVNLILNGDAVGIPAEAAADVVALHGPVAGDDVLDGGAEEVAIVRRSWREEGG